MSRGQHAQRDTRQNRCRHYQEAQTQRRSRWGSQRAQSRPINGHTRVCHAYTSTTRPNGNGQIFHRTRILTKQKDLLSPLYAVGCARDGGGSPVLFKSEATGATVEYNISYGTDSWCRDSNMTHLFRLQPTFCIFYKYYECLLTRGRDFLAQLSGGDSVLRSTLRKPRCDDRGRLVSSCGKGGRYSAQSM